MGVVRACQQRGAVLTHPLCEAMNGFERWRHKAARQHYTRPIQPLRRCIKSRTFCCWSVFRLS